LCSTKVNSTQIGLPANEFHREPERWEDKIKKRRRPGGSEYLHDHAAESKITADGLIRVRHKKYEGRMDPDV